MPLWEACVDNYTQAIAKEKLGADRIELCTNLAQGGTTPSFGTIKTVLRDTSIPVMVMIRPRGGNFHFSHEEVDIMLEDIEVVKKLGANGIVLGALKGKEIDLALTKILSDKAKPLEITFHMAFDEVKDKFKAIDQLIELGIQRILTRGGASDALAGKNLIKELVDYAGERIVIMPGKGITKNNRDHIARFTRARELHGTRIV